MWKRAVGFEEAQLLFLSPTVANPLSPNIRCRCIAISAASSTPATLISGIRIPHQTPRNRVPHSFAFKTFEVLRTFNARKGGVQRAALIRSKSDPTRYHHSMAKSSTLPLNRTLLPTGSRIAVAVSGGADSTALLLALHEQAAAFGIAVAAAHLHHGLRGAEADADRDFLRTLCRSKDIPLLESQASIPAQQAEAPTGSNGTEELARHARLRFFATVLHNKQADLVATAHTADDQAETVLMKLIRGAWLEGLAGIAPVLELSADGSPAASSAISAARVIRPLLAATREQVVAFLQARNQPWREDSTNATDAHTRNRVRHHLMPLLRDLNPNLAQTLSQTAELAREEEARWSAETARLYTELAIPGRPVRGGGRTVSTGPEEQTVAFDIARLRTLDLPSRRRLLRLAAGRMGVPLTSAETLRLLQLSGLAPTNAPPDPTVPTKPNSRLQLRNGLHAERSVRELRLSRNP